MGKFGEMVGQLEHEWGFSYETFKKDKWIAGSIEKGTRVHQIPFRHYREIASFETDEQKIWVKKILENMRKKDCVNTQTLSKCLKQP